MKDCQNGCDRKFVSILNKEKTLKIRGNGKVHCKMYYYMRGTNTLQPSDGNWIKIKSTQSKAEQDHRKKAQWPKIEGETTLTENAAQLIIILAIGSI